MSMTGMKSPYDLRGDVDSFAPGDVVRLKIGCVDLLVTGVDASRKDAAPLIHVIWWSEKQESMGMASMPAFCLVRSMPRPGGLS